MSLVFVFGAGASYGERLLPLADEPDRGPANDANPPLSAGFFARSLYDSIGYPPERAESDFSEAFEYIRWAFALSEPVGDGRWARLNIEDVFTCIEMDREFRNPESDVGGKLVITRNKLVRYLWRIIASCTQYKRGEYYERIKAVIDQRLDTSILSFNWDLLLDQEFMSRSAPWEVNTGHYANFLNLVLGEPHVRIGMRGQEPMLLKLHGSLNWFQCMNPRCPAISSMEILPNTQDCLYRARGIHLSGLVTCQRCGTEMNPLLIPPLLRKPVTDNWIIRAIWGQAIKKLREASKVVIVGFSAPPTDFYAAWLLRSTLGTRPNDELEVFVVNPLNNPADRQHEDFANRMASIFPHGYNSDFFTFSEVGSILDRIRTE